MSHRMYLYNLSGTGEDGDQDGCLPLMEWKYEFPLMLHPLFAEGAFVDFNCYNAPGSQEGLYAPAMPGIEALRRFYDFIARHATSLVDDQQAFDVARRRIFALLDGQAVHDLFHLDAWDVFNLSHADRTEQAHSLLSAIGRTNALVHQAIKQDDPTCLDDCLQHERHWASDFRAVFNDEVYDYGWSAISSMVDLSHDGLEIFEEDGLFGLRRLEGGIAVPARYEDLQPFDISSGLRIAMRDGLAGYLDGDGREIIPCQFQTANEFVDAVASVRRDGRWGLIDRHGTVHLPCTFMALQPLGHDGERWRARTADGWGIIDNSGAWLVPAAYREIIDGYDHYRLRDRHGRWTVLAMSLKPLGGDEIDKVDRITVRGGREAYRLRRRHAGKRLYRVVDPDGACMLPGEFQHVDYVEEADVWLVKNGGFGLYDGDGGRGLLPCRYARIVKARGLIGAGGDRRALLVQDDTQWGLYRVEPSPGWSIAPAYEHLEHLKSDVLACYRDGRWGLIDSHGHLVRDVVDPLPPHGMFVPPGRLAMVFDGECAWFVDRDGATEPVDAEHAAQVRAYAEDLGLSAAQLRCLDGRYRAVPVPRRRGLLRRLLGTIGAGRRD